MAATPDQDKVAPWGRFTLITKHPAEDSDHIYFRNKVTTIGRNKRRCDIVINKLFISSVHCVIQLDAAEDNNEEPTVKLHDNSRNGIWVNADRVGKGASVTLGKGFTIHFTKPNSTPAGASNPNNLRCMCSPICDHAIIAYAGVSPMAFKLEILNSSQAVVASKASKDINVSCVANESVEITQPIAALEAPSSLEKKRKRETADASAGTVAVQELTSQLVAAESQARTTELKLHAATSRITALSDELEHLKREKLDKLAQENLSLKDKLEKATKATFQLTSDLVLKDEETECQINDLKKRIETVNKANQALKEEVAAMDKATALKIQEAIRKNSESDELRIAEEVATKVKVDTKKYQQRIEAEVFEERREMSEKMAMYVNENENLQSTLDAKEEMLAKSKEEITSLLEKVAELETKVGSLMATEKEMVDNEEKNKKLEERLQIVVTKETQLAECKKKIDKLDKNIKKSNEENLEIVQLLAAAEEKVLVAENKASNATIAAAAAESNREADALKLQELQKAVTLLREELWTCRTQLASQEELHHQKPISILATTTTASPVPLSSMALDSSASEEDKEVLRAQLVKALSLFAKVQALGLEGATLLTNSKTVDPDEVDCPRTMSNLPLTSITNAPLQQVTKSSIDPVNIFNPEAATNYTTTESSQVIDAVHDSAAEPKESSSILNGDKKPPLEQIAQFAITKEAIALSTLVALQSVDSSSKESPSNAGRLDSHGKSEGDWEML
ncbi:hypothetical protein CCR75_005129 [Bremia lactucae]|uniref:FHA domain-containing protein n=1 Tax=Bremia lactucae TaxID=4779 RepID=A0A976FEI7_BRELC|nr:hypothetical protein CCR75_005129 [Bremia lactucae]